MARYYFTQYLGQLKPIDVKIDRADVITWLACHSR